MALYSEWTMYLRTRMWSLAAQKLHIVLPRKHFVVQPITNWSKTIQSPGFQISSMVRCSVCNGSHCSNRINVQNQGTVSPWTVGNLERLRDQGLFSKIKNGVIFEFSLETCKESILRRKSWSKCILAQSRQAIEFTRVKMRHSPSMFFIPKFVLRWLFLDKLNFKTLVILWSFLTIYMYIQRDLTYLTHLCDSKEDPVRFWVAKIV